MNLSKFRMKLKNKLWYGLKSPQLLRSWDDARYLKLLFRVGMGERLDLINPQTFNQKLQWLKIHDRRPEYTRMVDKYQAKLWVAEQIGKEYIVPNLGVWDSFDEIDFESLPPQFVLKCTHDSGGLAICDDRAAFDFAAARTKIEKSLATSYFEAGREWPYRDVKPRVLAEVYLPAWAPGATADGEAATVTDFLLGERITPGGGVVDYKFYCFHGEPKFLYVSQGLHDHETASMDFLTLAWEPTGFSRADYRRFRDVPPAPANLPRMIELARQLSTGIPFVRVDLFENYGHVVFSEMTFHPVSGMMPVEPRSADLEIGALLDLGRVEG